MQGVEIYFRDRLVVRVFLEDNGIRWEGDFGGYRAIVGHYQRLGYEGEALLKVLLERLQGNTWSQEIGNNHNT